MNSPIRIPARDRLRTWLAANNNKVLESEIADDTPIVERRIITSIQIMDLLLFIQEASGKSIDAEDLKAGSFKDINTICETFFEVSDE